ncbi:hypothetical protein [Paraburkholderia sp.]|uniref:hypothetical protein n=1 Tax=Paraburkholderia sp. TaxID=1926495 RepID=UPI0039E62625
MTDSVASPQSRPRRAASKKQRQGGVSTETENKLARAARSAQRLAQLSGVPRDDSTLDLFPDDPTRATLEAMNIDVRQGTLDGFELPDVVLQAVGALDDGASSDKAARRVPRAAKVDAPMPVNEQLSGFDIEPAMPDGAVNSAGEATPKIEVTASDKLAASARDQSTPPASTMAAATVARSVTALRQAAETGSAASSTFGGGKPPQRSASVDTRAASAAPWREGQHAEPELDRARATAFADTVDALYGVIADQRRAATDHSRRMKWMLSIVVGALLVTVAIGIAQTLLLMRLTRETSAQQYRIEQMMQNQQAAMVSLLDTHTALAAAAANAASAPAATMPAAPAQAGATPLHDRRAARTPHGHKAKALHSN